MEESLHISVAVDGLQKAERDLKSFDERLKNVGSGVRSANKVKKEFEEIKRSVDSAVQSFKSLGGSSDLVDSLERSLIRTGKAVDKLSQTKSVQQLSKDLDQAVRSINHVTKNMIETARSINKSSSSINKMAESFKTATSGMTKSLNTSQRALNSWSSSIGQSFNQTASSAASAEVAVKRFNSIKPNGEVLNQFKNVDYSFYARNLDKVRSGVVLTNQEMKRMVNTAEKFKAVKNTLIPTDGLNALDFKNAQAHNISIHQELAKRVGSDNAEILNSDIDNHLAMLKKQKALVDLENRFAEQRKQTMKRSKADESLFKKDADWSNYQHNFKKVINQTFDGVKPLKSMTDETDKLIAKTKEYINYREKMLSGVYSRSYVESRIGKQATDYISKNPLETKVNALEIHKRTLAEEKALYDANIQREKAIKLEDTVNAKRSEHYRSYENKLQKANQVLQSEKSTVKQLEKQIDILRNIEGQYRNINNAKTKGQKELLEKTFKDKHGNEAFGATASYLRQDTINKLQQAQAQAHEHSLVKTNAALQLAGERYSEKLKLAEMVSQSSKVTNRELQQQINYLNKINSLYSSINNIKDPKYKAVAMADFNKSYGTLASTNQAHEKRLQLINQLHQKQAANIEAAKIKSADLHGIWRGIAASVGSLWLSWGSFASMAAGLAVGQSIFQSLSVNREFGWQMEQVGIAADASSAKLLELKQHVLSLNESGSLQGPKQMAEGLRFLAQAGMSAEEALQNLPTVLNFALVGGITDERSSHFLAGLRSAFNLKTKDALREGADTVAKAANISQTSIDAMSEALRQASSEAARFGLSVADTSAMLGILATYNIEGSAAGTSMKRFLSDLAGRTPKATKALEQLGLTFYNKEGMVKPFVQVVEELQQKFRGLTDQQKQVWLKSIFDERALKSANILLSESGQNFAKMRLEILRASENMGYTSQQAERLGNTAEGSFRKMKNAWEGAFASTGMNSEGIFKDLMTELTKLSRTQAVRDSMIGLTHGFLELAKFATGAVNAIMPLSSVIMGTLAAVSVSAASKMLIAWTGGAAGLRNAFVATQNHFATFGASMANAAAVTTNTTGKVGLATRAISGMGVALRGVSAFLGGWVGIAAIGVGALVTYLTRAREATFSLSDEIKKLDTNLGSVDFEKYDKFNQSGYGNKLDQVLGIGYIAPDVGKALINPQTLSDYSTNTQRIVDATRQMVEQVKKESSEGSQYQLEQTTMLTERKITLLKEQLTQFDKTTAHMVELDAESKNVRLNLENQLFLASKDLMEQRTQLAIQQLREIKVEAAKTMSIWDKFWNWASSGDTAGKEAANIKYVIADKQNRGVTLNEDEKRYLYLVGNGESEAVAAAKVNSSSNPNAATNTGKYFRNVDNHKIIREQISANPQLVLDKLIEDKKALEQQVDYLNARYHNDPHAKNNYTLAQIKDLGKSIDYISHFIDVAKNEIKQGTQQQIKARTNGGEGVTNKSLPNIGTPSINGKFDSGSKSRNDMGQQIVNNHSSNLIKDYEFAVKNFGVNSREASDAWNRARQLAVTNDTGNNLTKRAELQDKIDELKVSIKSGNLSPEETKQANQNLAVLVDALADLNKSIKNYNKSILPTPDTKGRKMYSDKQEIALAKQFGVSRLAVDRYFTNPKTQGARQHNTNLEQKYNLPEFMLNAIYSIESDSGHNTSVSSAGAEGPYQFLKGTAKDMGLNSKTVYDFHKASEAAAKYLQRLIKYLSGKGFKGQDLVNATYASYNWGHGNVAKARDKFGDNWLQHAPSETRNYVKTANDMSKLHTLNSQGISQATNDLIGQQADKLNIVTLSLTKQNALSEERIRKLSNELDADQKRYELLQMSGGLTRAEIIEEERKLEIKRIELEYEKKIAELRSKGTPQYDSQGNLSLPFKQVEQEKTAAINHANTKAKMKEAETTFEGGFTKSMRTWYDSMTQYGELAAQGLQQTFSLVSDNLVQMATTGRTNFREMGREILKIIAQIAMRMAIAKIVEFGIGMVTGGGSGGGSGASAGAVVAQAKGGAFEHKGTLTAYASGGVVNSPTNFLHKGGRGLMGENGPEAIMPLTRLSNGDLGVRMAGGAGGSNVNAPVTVNIVVNNDGEGGVTTESNVDAQQARQFGETIRMVVLDELSKSLRSGGMIHSAIKGAN